ncbi:MAG TPA: cupin domain-containing protein [Pseudonocardiaceae bacterium]|jgi:quercetin dioxygenase-like cupin family protein|nr:cupin domain-containing protein [Pseudonocardiaceae bacterium]
MSAHVLPSGGGRTFGPGINVKIEYGQSDGFAVFESELPPASDGPPPHLHRVYDEAFYVIAGNVAFSVDSDTRDCPTGSFVFVPRGVAHGFANPAGEPARILVITSPGAIQLVEAIYDLLSRGGPPDFEAMAALYASHRSEILGAPSQ